MKSNTLKKNYINTLRYVLFFAHCDIFFTSTVVADLWGDLAIITQVKQGILSCVSLLVVAMMTTGITAKKLYRTKPTGVFAAKEMRMKIAAANGIFILIPAAYFLASWSTNGQFDQVYWTVQIVELIAGFTNAVLMGLNIRDGIRLGKKSEPLRAQCKAYHDNCMIGALAVPLVNGVNQVPIIGMVATHLCQTFLIFSVKFTR